MRWIDILGSQKPKPAPTRPTPAATRKPRQVETHNHLPHGDAP